MEAARTSPIEPRFGAAQTLRATRLAGALTCLHESTLGNARTESVILPNDYWNSLSGVESVARASSLVAVSCCCSTAMSGGRGGGGGDTDEIEEELVAPVAVDANSGEKRLGGVYQQSRVCSTTLSQQPTPTHNHHTVPRHRVGQAHTTHLLAPQGASSMTRPWPTTMFGMSTAVCSRTQYPSESF